MKVTSPDFSDGQPLPVESAMRGDNKRPTLLIENAPDNTASFAVLVHDPDAPNGDFAHWVAWNFSPHIANIPGDNVPAGVVEGVNDMNQTGWVGPAPPSGTHHYHFVVYALNSMLALPAEITKESFLSNIQEKILDQAEIVGLFSAD